MPFTAANHYDFNGDDITGTLDAHRSDLGSVVRAVVENRV